MRHDRVLNFFARSTASLLLLTAAAKFYSASGTAKLLTATDPLIHLKYRPIMIGVGSIELAIGLYLLFGRRAWLKPWLIFWISSNFMMYRFANDLLHLKLCPCLGTIADLLPIRKDVVDFSLMIMVLYFFLGSVYFLLREWSRKLQSPHCNPITADQADAASPIS
jgi:hypothetical protein